MDDLRITTEDAAPTSAGSEFSAAQWYALRRVQSFQPRSYTCPLCGQQLHAMSDHILVKPEGDPKRRRHAHSLCVLNSRTRGELPTAEEYKRSLRQQQPQPPPGPFSRLFRRTA